MRVGEYYRFCSISYLSNPGATTIEQRLVFVGREEGKLLAIRQLVQEVIYSCMK